MCAFQSTISNIRIKLVNFALIIEVSASSSRKMKMVNHNVNHKTIELINSLKNKEKIRILFVCLGNICRSPAGEGVFAALADERGVLSFYKLDSAGFYGGHRGDLPDSRMRRAASRRGLNLRHRSRTVTTSDFYDFDIIIGMDDNNISSLHGLAPSPETEAKIVRMTDFARNNPQWDYVPDPYYEGAEGFELVLDLLEDACGTLLDETERLRESRDR